VFVCLRTVGFDRKMRMRSRTTRIGSRGAQPIRSEDRPRSLHAPGNGQNHGSASSIPPLQSTLDLDKRGAPNHLSRRAYGSNSRLAPRRRRKPAPHRRRARIIARCGGRSDSMDGSETAVARSVWSWLGTGSAPERRNDHAKPAHTKVAVQCNVRATLTVRTTLSLVPGRSGPF
jgi:hypothetical protein